MAGIKLTGRTEASTILEVVISMVVIIVVFGIAMMIYSNILRFSLSAKKLRAEAFLQETMQDAEKNADSSSRTFTKDDFRIEQGATSYENEHNLIDIHLTAYDQNGLKIAELQKVIISQQ